MRTRGRHAFQLTRGSARLAVSIAQLAAATVRPSLNALLLAWCLASVLSALVLAGCRGGGPGDITPPASNETGSQFVWLMDGGDAGHTGLVDTVGPQTGTPVRETVRDVVFPWYVRIASGGGLVYSVLTSGISACDANLNLKWTAPLNGTGDGLAYAPDGLLYVLDQVEHSKEYEDTVTADLVALDSSGAEERRVRIATDDTYEYFLSAAVNAPGVKGGFYLLCTGTHRIQSAQVYSSRIMAYSRTGEELWRLEFPEDYYSYTVDENNGRIAVSIPFEGLRIYSAEGELEQSWPLETLSYSYDTRVRFLPDGRLCVVYNEAITYESMDYRDGPWYMVLFDAEDMSPAEPIELPNRYSGGIAMYCAEDGLYLWGQALDNTSGPWGIECLDYTGSQVSFTEVDEDGCTSIIPWVGGRFILAIKTPSTAPGEANTPSFVAFRAYKVLGPDGGLTELEPASLDFIELDRDAGLIYTSSSTPGLKVHDADGKDLSAREFLASTAVAASLLIASDGTIITGNYRGFQAMYQDGTPLWQVNRKMLDAMQLASPAGPVLCRTYTEDGADYLNELSAYNLGGSLLWETAVNAGGSPLGNKLDSWLADGQGAVYVLAENGHPQLGYSEDGMLLSKLDAASGEAIWTTGVSLALEGCQMALGDGGLRMASSEQLAVVGTDGELVIELDADSVYPDLGSYQSGNITSLSVLPAGGMMMVIDGTILAVYDADYTLEWWEYFSYGQKTNVVPSLRPDGSCWLAVCDDPVEMYNMGADGTMLSHLIISDEPTMHTASSTYLTSAMITDSQGTAYIGLKNGIYAIDSTGALKWSYERENLGCQALALTQNGRLFALTTGRLLEF